MKRIIFIWVVIILMITIVVLIPLLTFAIPQSGDQCTTGYVDTLVGSDGGNFYRSGVQTSIRYYPDGSAGAFSHENYSGPRQHYLIMPDGETDYYGYCIQQGESFPDAQRYTGVGWTNDSYFSKLPTTAQTGIMLATLFGWQPGQPVPVPGCNDDDWYWATQVIIWEYQQKLRISPTIIQGNGYVSTNYFQSTLAGRPAEKCYNYILESMIDYQKIPNFASIDSSNAPINILKWDSSKLCWSATVNDTNQILQPLISDDTTIKIEQKGNLYTFTSTIQLDLKTIKFTKNVPLPSHELLIWGGANRTQAIATGAANPINFFAQFRTEMPGTIEILKTSEDKKKEGFIFNIMDQNGQSTNLATNQDGLSSAQLYPGEYMVAEEETLQYRMPQNQTIEIQENETTKLEILNILKKGQIQIQKKVNDSISNIFCAEQGAMFQIYSDDYSTFENTPDNQRDEVATDNQGTATSKELPLGSYIVHQTVTRDNVTLSKDIAATIEYDMQTVSMAIDNQFQKGKIEVLKTDETNQPLEGAKLIIRNSEDINLADGSLKYPKGSMLGTIISDGNGMGSSDWLYPGTYELEEVEAPAGYLLPNNPFTTVLLVAEDQTTNTFFKQISIKNIISKAYPNTGDKTRRTNPRTLLFLMLMSLIGIGVLTYMMRELNKTLH